MLAVLVVGLSMPALAAAQLGPTNVPDALKSPDPSQTPGGPVDNGDDGLSTLQLVLMFGGAAAIIGVIAFVIVRDARRRAPSGRGGSSSKDKGSAGAAGAAKGSGKSAREREREQAAKRKKAKAARDQRKHNRPR